jgi:hypothetical protein
MQRACRPGSVQRLSAWPCAGQELFATTILLNRHDIFGLGGIGYDMLRRYFFFPARRKCTYNNAGTVSSSPVSSSYGVWNFTLTTAVALAGDASGPIRTRTLVCFGKSAS